MPTLQTILQGCVVVSIAVLVESRPTSDNLPPSSIQSWEDWSNTASGPWPSPTNSTGNGTSPAYNNTAVTIEDLFNVPDLSGFDFNATNPEPYNPNDPDPQGKLMTRIAQDEADIPAFITLAHTTQQSTDALVNNVNAVLTNAELDSSNSVLAEMLLQSIHPPQGQRQRRYTNATTSASDNDAAVVTLRELSLFLESCLLDYDSCLFWDADTMEIVDASFAIASTDLWSLKSEDQSVWPTIAQWVINSGVDILVGDRPITHDMVVPVRLIPGGVVSAALPALIPSIRNS